MNNTIFVLSLLGMTAGKQSWEPCGLPGGCYCSVPVLNQIQCLTDVKVLPFFNDTIKPGVTSITFHGSQIVGLAPFLKDQWDRLKHLNFIDTPLIPCKAIAKLQRPGLRILSECVTPDTQCPPPSTCPDSKERTIFLSAILVFVILLGWWLGIIVYYLYFHKRTVPRESTRETWL